ncbi:hypothetical protein M569_09078, partial [Genlisea aurea]
LVLNCLLLAVGGCAGPMVMRLYFIHGGSLVWFSSWQETGGWPVIFVPLVISYLRRLTAEANAAPVLINLRLFLAAAVIGVLTGVDNYIYAFGLEKLPVSTSSLVIATQLAFTALFGFLIVKLRFTAYSINAVVLLTVGAAVLAISASGDRPAGESRGAYWLGFFLTLGAAALYGFVLPLVELAYRKANLEMTYTLVMEVQLVMCFFATAFCTVGMFFNKEFQKIRREEREYKLGSATYYVVVVLSCLAWQGFFLGAIGVIHYSSSLVSGIIIAITIPVNELLGVIFYGEKFGSQKGVSLGLSLWGFLSYFYGEYKSRKKANNDGEET